MGKLDFAVEDTIVQLIVTLIKENKENIVGVYLVPFLVGNQEKMELTLVTKSKNSSSEMKYEKIGNVDVTLSDYPWEAYQKKSELDDILYIGNYAQIRDLKDAVILYDPENKLATKKEELRKRPGIITYYNCSLLTDRFIKYSISQIKESLEEEKGVKKKSKDRKQNSNNNNSQK